jgi:hypothetical protein
MKLPASMRARAPMTARLDHHQRADHGILGATLAAGSTTALGGCRPAAALGQGLETSGAARAK